MKAVRFVGDPNDLRDPGSGPKEIKVKGVDFVKGEWVTLEDDVAKKFANHTHFQTEDLDEDEK